MGKCSTIIREVRAIIEDDVSHLYVLVEAVGDCPVSVQGWHYKAIGNEPVIEAIGAWLASGEYLSDPLRRPHD